MSRGTEGIVAVRREILGINSIFFYVDLDLQHMVETVYSH